MLDQDKRCSDKKKEKMLLYFEQKLSYAFFVSFLRLVVIYEDIRVLYWFGQVLFETVL